MHDKLFRGQEVTCDGKFGLSEEFKGNGLMTDISFRYFFGEFQTVFHKKFFFRNSSKKYWLQAKVYKNYNTDINKNASVIFQWRHGLFSIQMITK